MDQNWTNQNGIFQLSVAYMGPLATLSCHLEGLTPLTPVATHRMGSKFTHIQIYYTKKENKSTMERREGEEDCIVFIWG